MNGTRSEPIDAGFGAISHGKLVLLLALTTAALGVSGAMPLAPLLHDSVAGTLAGDHFIRNHPTFAPTDFFDLRHQNLTAFVGARRAAGWAGLLGLVAQAFFAGGMIAVLGRGPFSFGQFFEPARRNFWHNVKCGLLFLVLLVVVFGLWLGAVGAGVHKILESTPPDAASRAATRWILWIGAVLLFGACSILYDFARAARRYSPAIGAWRAFGFARRAASGAWGRALGIFLFWLFAGGLAVLLSFAVAWEMPAVSPPGILLLFLVQFAIFWIRSAARVGAWGSYLALLDPRASAALAAAARVRVIVADPRLAEPV